MKINTLMILLTMSMFLIAGCQVALPSENVPGQESGDSDIVIVLDDVVSEGELQEMEETTDDIVEGQLILEAVEGDLVFLQPEAEDPDGDKITYTFTKPFNENGKWQTKAGDEGKYLVTIVASDGKEEVSEDILVVILKANQAPVIECPEEVVVKETEQIMLDCNIYDPEGDSVVIEYTGFMKESTYTTTFEDAGEYTTVIKASDKEKTQEKTVKIKILESNRAPEISGIPEEISLMETEVVAISPEVVDPDGDKVTITFSDPLNKNGIWQTEIGDAGTHKLSIVASDGESTIKKEFTVYVSLKNTEPVLKDIQDFTVYEGETIELPIDARDREGDQLTVEIKGWMNSPTYTTTYDDAGEYTVTIVVTDGVYEVKDTFTITVLDRNRPPYFVVPA